MGLPNLRFVIVTALAVGTLSACVPAPKVGRMLVSITGVHLESNEAVYTASLEFEYLRVRAICHIPAGWTMAAGNPSRYSLIVEGRASSDAYDLKNDAVKELAGLVLVEPWNEGTKIDKRPNDKIHAVLYVKPDGAIYELSASKIIVEPADRCPAPME